MSGWKFLQFVEFRQDALLRAEAARLAPAAGEPNALEAATDDGQVAPQLLACQHLASQREDFEGSREGILVWLTELDLRLTDVEHFSDGDAEDKMRQLKEFQHEITLNADKIDALIVLGENLIQKSAPPDAALIQDELEELHSCCQQVFGRAARFHRRLVRSRATSSACARSLLQTSVSPENDVPEEEGQEGEGEELPASGPPSPFKDTGQRQASRQPPPPPPPDRSSGRETPVSVDSSPLEWDPTVDVGGSSAREDDEDAQDAAFFGTPSAMPASDAAGRRRRPVSPPRRKVCSAAFHQQGYVKLMSECSGSIDDVKRVKSVLGDHRKAHRPPHLPGLTGDAHVATGVMERWEVVQARDVHRDVHRDDRGEERGEDPQQWRELQAELRDVTSWLDAKLPELEALQTLAPSTGLKDFEDNVRRLKETQRAFCVRKRALISLNLAGGGLDGRRLRELKAGLGSANRSWMRACGALERWEAGLHAALTQCQDFHEALRSLLLWLAQAERQVRAVGARRHWPSYAALSEQRDALQALREELRGRQAAAASLRAAAARLLLEAGGDRDDGAEAGEKVHAVGNKMKLLLRHVHESLAALDRDLKRQQEEGEEPADDGQVDVQKRAAAVHTTPSGRKEASAQRTRLKLTWRTATVQNKKAKWKNGTAKQERQPAKSKPRPLRPRSGTLRSHSTFRRKSDVGRRERRRQSAASSDQPSTSERSHFVSPSDLRGWGEERRRAGPLRCRRAPRVLEEWRGEARELNRGPSASLPSLPLLLHPRTT